jgi:ankyrin repeat protein
MKLFQAFLIMTVFLLINSPSEAPVSVAVPVSSEIAQPSSADLSTPKLSLSPDSLQNQFERAVWDNNTVLQQELISLGADVNKISATDGYAALHWAVERDLIKTVRLLVTNGADINLLTRNAVGNDRTPLHIASELGHASILTYLLEQGADVQKRTVHGETALHGVRLFVKDESVVKTLIEYGADVNAVTEFGATPLHAAAMLGSKSIINILIENGAVIDAPNKRGLTALHQAAQQGHLAVVEQLIDAKANIEAQTRTGDTAMHLAAKKGHSAIIKTLLTRGADPLMLNKFSKSPLSEAQERAMDQVVEMMSAATSLDQEG